METNSLLKQNNYSENSDAELINNSKIEEPTEEVRMTFILKNLIPNIAISFVFFFLQIIQIHFIGKTKDLTMLKAIGLGNTFNQLFFFIPIFGLAQAISVECSKTFGGKHLTLLGHQANQVRIIILVFFSVLMIMSLFLSKSILLLFAGEGKTYVDEAASFVIKTIPGIFFDSQNSFYSNFSEAHLHYTPIYISLATAVCVQFIGSYLLISVYNLGITGAALSYDITAFTSLAVYVLYYTFRNPFPESNFFCKRETFKWDNTFKHMLSVCFSTMTVLFALLGGTHVLEVICNKLPEISYSKVVVLNSIFYTLSSLSEAWMLTNSILVGIFIGENSPKKIKIYIKNSFYLSLIIMIPVYIASFLFRFSLAKFFTENEDLLNSNDLDLLLITVPCIHLVIFMQEFLIGIIRGFEMHFLANSVSCAVFLVFMPVLASVLMFIFGMDALGYGLAMLISFAVASVVWIVVLFFINFEEICSEYHDIEIKEIREFMHESVGAELKEEDVVNVVNDFDYDNNDKDDQKKIK